MLGQLFISDYYNNPELNKFHITLPLNHFL